MDRYSEGKIIRAAAIVAIVLIIIAAAAGAMPAASGETVNSAQWSDVECTVINPVNEFAWTISAKWKLDTTTGAIIARISAGEVKAKAHYLAISGYGFTGFKGWTKTATGEYEGTLAQIGKKVEITAEYRADTLNVTYLDGVSGDELGNYKVSYGGSVKAPAPRDYAERGLVFVGWSGGDADNVTENLTIYSKYEPARYLTVTQPDGGVKKVAVAYGSTLKDALDNDGLAYGGKTLKGFKSAESGKAVELEQAVEYDMELTGVYGGTMPQWGKTTLIVISALIGAALVIWVSVVVMRKVRKKNA